MQFGLGVLKLPPEAFWAMGIPEFKAAMEGCLQSIGVEDGEGILREELVALQHRFPDEENIMK